MSKTNITIVRPTCGWYLRNSNICKKAFRIDKTKIKFCIHQVKVPKRNTQRVVQPPKEIYVKYSKPYLLAATMDCFFSDILNHGLNLISFTSQVSGVKINSKLNLKFQD